MLWNVFGAMSASRGHDSRLSRAGKSGNCRNEGVPDGRMSGRGRATRCDGVRASASQVFFFIQADGHHVPRYNIQVPTSTGSLA